MPTQNKKDLKVMKIFLIILVFFNLLSSLSSTNNMKEDRNKCAEWYWDSEFPEKLVELQYFINQSDAKIFLDNVYETAVLIEQYSLMDADECFIELQEDFVALSLNVLIFKTYKSSAIMEEITIPANSSYLLEGYMYTQILEMSQRFCSLVGDICMPSPKHQAL